MSAWLERTVHIVYALLGSYLVYRVLIGGLSGFDSAVVIVIYAGGAFWFRHIRRPHGVAVEGRRRDDVSVRSQVVKDLLGFAACLLGACVVGTVGAVMQPATTIGIVLFLVPVAALVVAGMIIVARVTRRLLKF